MILERSAEFSGASLHSLHQFKSTFFNNWLMSVLYQIGVKLPLILFPPAGQKIGREGFLHPHLANVLFIRQCQARSKKKM